MSILDRPVIKYFKSNADEVMANEEIVLEWEVENARKVRLDGVEMSAKGNYNLFINDSRTFELTANNWAGKESETLAVRLFRPVVLSFDTDSTTIKEGEAINIHFQVKHTQSWKITAEYNMSLGYKKETIAEGRIENLSEAFNNSISAQLKGACVLNLVTRNGFESGTETIKLHVRHLSLSLSASQTVVKPGSSVHLTWKAQHANKIILNPGSVDVTNVSFYDFIMEGDRDILLELKAFGDFGQQAIDSKMLFLARISNVTASNNGDANDPLFYLSWSATGVKDMKLLPENIPVSETEINFKIPARTSSIEYILTGETYSGEELSKVITLHPCSIQHFILEKGKVIIGAMATLTWKVQDTSRIQLKFADSPGVIDVLITESTYHFQVFEGRNRVTLIAWGDINVVQLEIPIPAFESPVIKSLQVPTLNFQLGLTWIASPLIKPSQRVTQLFSLMNNTTGRGKNFYWKIGDYLSMPSSWLLTKTKKVFTNKNGKVDSQLENTVSKKIYSLTEKVSTALNENLTKEIHNEQ